jgi:hypothetical protein
MVLIGLPHLASLRRAEAKLCANNIPHFSWHEPDFNDELTAIATSPIAGEQRKALANYRVYNHAAVAQHRPEVSSDKEHSVLTERPQTRNLPAAPDFSSPVAQPASAAASKADDVCSSHTGRASAGGAAASAACP